MSSSPSPSKSKTAAPEPTICGMKYFEPSTGPASWTKSSPTISVTSSNQGGAVGAARAAPGADARQPRRQTRRQGDKETRREQRRAKRRPGGWISGSLLRCGISSAPCVLGFGKPPVPLGRLRLAGALIIAGECLVGGTVPGVQAQGPVEPEQPFLLLTVAQENGPYFGTEGRVPRPSEHGLGQLVDALQVGIDLVQAGAALAGLGVGAAPLPAPVHV